jgi:AraC-like DNA-binding protein
MDEPEVTLEEFERGLHELTPLEAKCKLLKEKVSRSAQGLAQLIAQAKQDLVAEGYAIYARPYEPVDIRDGFIAYTDQSPISAIYQSRYLPVFAHTHDFIEAIYVYEGTCNLITGDTVTALVKGDLCIVAPSCRHDHSVTDDTSIILLIAIKCDTFNDTFFSLLPHQDILSDFFLQTLYEAQVPRSLLFRTGLDSQVSSTVLEMHYERSMNRQFCGSMLSNLLTRLLLLLLRNHQESVEIVDSGTSGTTVRLVPVLRDIQAHLGETTLKGLSEKFGFSTSRLSRLIKTHTGKTYMLIVREMRTKRVAKLLENPHLSMADIAETVGYFDLSHLTKDFKWYYQTTPGLYRKKLHLETPK